MIDPNDEIFSVRDILDSQLQTRDRRKIGRVADIEAETRADGSLKLTYLVVGPQALAGRVHPRLRAFLRFFFRDPFTHRIPLNERTQSRPPQSLPANPHNYTVRNPHPPIPQ